MRKAVIAALFVASALIGVASVSQATHDAWVKRFWEEQDRARGG